jgi:hypothetical protein
MKRRERGVVLREEEGRERGVVLREEEGRERGVLRGGKGDVLFFRRRGREV